MQFRTILKDYPICSWIHYSSRILIMGSCFAEHLHRYLSQHRYHTFLNPCGISYNPISIAVSGYYQAGLIDFNAEQITSHNERFFHFDFHGDFAGINANDVKDKAVKHLESARAFGTPDILVLSLGTAYIYKLKQSGELVNNCHKVPNTAFDKIKLTPEDIYRELHDLCSMYKKHNQKLKIILTISPVRHLKDGMIENNRSKAALFLAVERLVEENTDVAYFPSYELLMDDLRDYRFYGRDLLHPSEEAVEYILGFFERHFLSEEDKMLRTQIAGINKRLQHRPFLPASGQHRDFLGKLRDDMLHLEKMYGLDFSDAIKNTTDQLNH